jgi:hypothetical protein
MTPLPSLFLPLTLTAPYLYFQGIFNPFTCSWIHLFVQQLFMKR